MQGKKSGLAILIPIALAALAGGLFLADQLGAGESNDPVDVLMRVERFYREDLAYRYASLEISDSRLERAAENIKSFFERNKNVLREFEERLELDPNLMQLVHRFNWSIKEIVESTESFFSNLVHVRHLFESSRELTPILERLGIFLNLGKILYVPMDQVRTGTYVKLLNETVAALDKMINSREAMSLENGTFAKLADLYRGIYGILANLRIMYDEAAEFDRKCSEYIKPGSSCTWTLHQLVMTGMLGSDYSSFVESLPNIDLTLPLFFNDVAALVHSYAEFVSETSPMGRVKIGHITIGFSKIHDQSLLDAAKAWASIVTLLENKGWPYSSSDVQSLKAIVIDDYAWMRVGSAAGHATHIEKEGETFKIRYYDYDMDVNEIFAKLASEHAPGAEVKALDDGVEIKITNAGDLLKIARLLAFVTSLDLLIVNYGEQAVEARIKETVEKLHILS